MWKIFKNNQNKKMSINDLNPDQCIAIEENFENGMSPTEISHDLDLPVDVIFRYKNYRIKNPKANNPINTTSQQEFNVEEQIKNLRARLSRDQYMQTELEDLTSEMNSRKRLRELQIEEKELELRERKLQLKEDYGLEDDEVEGKEDLLTGTLGTALLNLFNKNKEQQTSLESNTSQGNFENAPVETHNLPGAPSLKTFSTAEIKAYIATQPKDLIKKAKKMPESELFAVLQQQMPNISAVSIKEAVNIIKSGEI